MSIAYVALVFVVLLLFALFWSRTGARSVIAEERPEPMPDAAAEDGAGADPMATMQFHSSALVAREPRKGGIDIREKQPRLIGISRGCAASAFRWSRPA